MLRQVIKHWQKNQSSNFNKEIQDFEKALETYQIQYAEPTREMSFACKKVTFKIGYGTYLLSRRIGRNSAIKRLNILDRGYYEEIA